jgi:DNA-binding MarR family transcriptional regulator
VGGPVSESSHPRHRLDPVVHFPIRLSILAVLSEVDEAEFRFIAETVEVNAATMSKQMTILEEAGLVRVRKGYAGRRPRTWLALTPLGREKLGAHLDALRSIVEPAPKHDASNARNP